MCKHYDVTYVSPVGTNGMHTAVNADNEWEAARKSPVMLSYGTPWKPEEFKVINVTESKNPPKGKEDE